VAAIAIAPRTLATGPVIDVKIWFKGVSQGMPEPEARTFDETAMTTRITARGIARLHIGTSCFWNNNEN
jgi:hypothetical protein